MHRRFVEGCDGRHVHDHGVQSCDNLERSIKPPADQPRLALSVLTYQQDGPSGLPTHLDLHRAATSRSHVVGGREARSTSRRLSTLGDPVQTSPETSVDS